MNSTTTPSPDRPTLVHDLEFQVAARRLTRQLGPVSAGFAARGAVLHHRRVLAQRAAAELLGWTNPLDHSDFATDVTHPDEATAAALQAISTVCTCNPEEMFTQRPVFEEEYHLARHVERETPGMAGLVAWTRSERTEHAYGFIAGGGTDFSAPAHTTLDNPHPHGPPVRR